MPGVGKLQPLGEVQAHAFRAMRFVFSVERNRKVFKRLFPPGLFAAFIDVGHYKQDVSLYRTLAQQWRGLSRESVSGTAAALEDINHGSGGSGGNPTRVIRGYVVTELLGSGAFGSVYRVHKERSAETVWAMKELNPSEHKERRERPITQSHDTFTQSHTLIFFKPLSPPISDKVEHVYMPQ